MYQNKILTYHRKGIDVPDIKFVVQWKATCDLCTLWQRYGRAARAPDQEAIAILLVEKKDMDEERVLKAQKEAKRNEKEGTVGLGIGTVSMSTQKDGKRKAISQLNPPAKRPALTDRTTIINRQEIVDSGDLLVDNEAAFNQTEGGDGQDTLKELRRAQYAKRVVRETEGSSTPFNKKGKRGGVVVGSSMDDFINAHVDFKCRRIVPMLVFGNDKRREYFKLYTFLRLCAHVTVQPRTTIFSVTPLRHLVVLAVDPSHPKYAAISVIQKLSQDLLSKILENLQKLPENLASSLTRCPPPIIISRQPFLIGVMRMHSLNSIPRSLTH